MIMYILTLVFSYSQIIKTTACNIAHISNAEKKKLSGFRIWSLQDTKVRLLYKITDLPLNSHRFSANVFELHTAILGSSPEGLLTF